MRRGLNPSFVMENDLLVGVCLGADWVSEHEWGIKELNYMFGTDLTKVGLDRHRITRFHESLLYRAEKDGATLPKQRGAVATVAPDVLSTTPEHRRSKFLNESFLDSELLAYDHGKGIPDMVCAWSGSTFGLAAYSQLARKNLAEIHQAFVRLDVGIWVGKPPVAAFTNGGLLLIIAPRVSPKHQKEMLDSDLDHLALLEASKKTGIESILKSAEKGTHALSPRWAKEAPAIKTKYDVVYWLNPRDQQANQSGWYSVEDLIQWSKGKGPVLKVNKKS